MFKECKVCAKPIKGRSDKIFCSTHCKNMYHKKLRYASKLAAIEINGYLKRNYAILLEVLGNNKTQIKVYRNLLEKKGFRFKYHTHFHVNSEGPSQINSQTVQGIGAGLAFFGAVVRNRS